MIKWKLHCPSRKQKRKNKPMTMIDSGLCDWLVLPLLLPTSTTKFSLDDKRRSGRNGNVLTLPTQILSSLRLRFSIFSRSKALLWLRLRPPCEWKPALEVGRKILSYINFLKYFDLEMFSLYSMSCRNVAVVDILNSSLTLNVSSWSLFYDWKDHITMEYTIFNTNK